MSYSRWLTSHWYTYYHVTDTLDRDAQAFDVCGVHMFTYAELKKDIWACLKTAQEEDGSEHPATAKQMDELRGYMEEFIRDVEEDEDISIWEDIKSGRLTALNVIGAWLKEFEDRMTQKLTTASGNSLTIVNHEGDIKAAHEAMDVIKTDLAGLTVVLPVLETDLGRSMAEKRLRT